MRARLEARFGLALVASTETFDGGRFPVIRPRDLELGHGFCIAIGRTHRIVEASFRPDNFARSLLRRMGEADQDARRTFEILCDQARASDLDVFLAVNGDATSSLEGDLGPWQRLELEVRRRLPTGQLAEGRVIEDTVVVATTCLALALCLLPVEELENPEFREVRSLPEGARMHIEVNRYERSPANRAACIAHYGTVCQVCGLSFADAYGELGTGYIEVHHRVRVADIGQRYFVNPISDLVPVCANCHAMLHRRTPPLGLEELKDLLRRRKEDPT